MTERTVCVIGVWHLGIVNCVGFAEQGYRVLGLELDRDKAARLQAGTPPLFEPGLEDLMRRHLGSGRLTFTSEPEIVSEADYVVIAYDSPVNDKDEVDVTPVVKAARAIAGALGADVPVIITSQLPLGTSEKVEADLRKRNPRWRSGVVYTPENLRLGSAIPRFLEPDMLVLGANDERARRAALELYRPFSTEKVPMDLRSAEMVKHALNTFLATSITFINEMANLADRLGADAVAVGRALKLDKRIGKSALMMPGLGFSGGTLARDVTQLRTFAKELGYKAKLLDAIVSVNEGTFGEILVKLRGRLGKLAGRRVGFLGLTYKPGTSTVRRSPAIKIMQKLKAAGAKCAGFDPAASDEELAEYTGLFARAKTADELATGADALVLVTEWPEFRDLDFAAMAKLMKRPVIVDSKNHLDPQRLTAAGFDYQGFGRSIQTGARKKAR
ncbi:MAG TPA: nucleotide sugar dehydrogenase [Candidatus Limnocylindria bacterium]|nr:nucleotide sugar dehydrogenase [Candidatus Limnocylindria bacterium]